MNDFVAKFVLVEKDISEERGGFSFFAVLLREDAPNVWDVVISAPWLPKDKKSSLHYIVKKMRARLHLRDIMKISRVVLLRPDEPSLREIYRQFNFEHECREIRNEVLFGMEMKRGYIITSKRKASSGSNHSRRAALACAS